MQGAAEPSRRALGPGRACTGLCQVGDHGKDDGHKWLDPVGMQGVEKLLAGGQLIQHAHSQVGIDSRGNKNGQQDRCVADPVREQGNQEKRRCPAGISSTTLGHWQTGTEGSCTVMLRDADELNC